MQFDDGSLIRKKVLLVVLARQEATRLGLVPPAGELQAAVDAFRLRFDLTGTDDMTAWLRSAGLNEHELARAISDLVLLRKVEGLYDDEITAALPSHVRINELQRRFAAASTPSVDLDCRDRWLQVNVSLSRRHGSALPGARALFARLAPAISKWRDRNTLQCFYFMRKSPDVRLRFLCSRPESDLLPHLENVLSGLIRAGLVENYFRSVYEPEIGLFGGPSAMERVHTYFDADSMAWIAFDQLLASGRQTMSQQDLLRVALNDMFERTVTGPSEVWDVWCNTADLAGRPEPLAPFEAERFSLAEVAGDITEDERLILRDYARANREFANALQQIWEDGKLNCGLRGILPYIAIFNANRHGLGAALGAIADGMVLACDPRKHLRGVASGAGSRVSRPARTCTAVAPPS